MYKRQRVETSQEGSEAKVRLLEAALKKTREELETSKNLLQAVIENTTDPIFVKDLQGRYLVVNSACASIFGQPVEEIIGKDNRDLFPCEVARKITSIDRRIIKTGETQSVEEVLPTTDLMRTYISTKTPYRDKTRKIIGLVGISRDITPRKQAEAALHKEQEFLNVLLDNLADGIVACDENGTLTLFNRATREFHGLPEKSIPSEEWRQYFDLYLSDRKTLMQQEDMPLFQALQGKTVRDMEMAIVPKQGKMRTVLASGQPIFSADGKKIGAVVAMHDITQRKQAKEALQKANEELERRVQERTNELSYAIEQLQAENADRKRAETALRQSEAQLREQTNQLQITLTELKRTQTQLVHTEKMSSLGQLVAGVAHEINNPVNFIYGNINPTTAYAEDLLKLLQLYQQNYPNPVAEIQAEAEEIDLDFIKEDLPKILNSMKVGADRIREIVLSLRTFSRLDEADMKAVDIHEGIDSTLLILQNRLKAKLDRPAIQIIKSYGKLPLVECYAGQLNQVFMNILTNALDALDELNSQRTVAEIKANPSIINISTEVNPKRSSVLIQIIDNGRGMAEEIRSKLFDPFFTTKPVGQGTGLGMSISYQIVVEKHRGKIKCISAPGKGAKFIIEIPINHIVDS